MSKTYIGSDGRSILHAHGYGDVTASLDAPVRSVTDEDGSPFGALVADSADPIGDWERAHDARVRIAAALAKCTARERVFILLYASGQTLEEIGKRVNLTRERVRQVIEDARRRCCGLPRLDRAPNKGRGPHKVCKDCGSDLWAGNWLLYQSKDGTPKPKPRCLDCERALRAGYFRARYAKKAAS